MKEPFQSARLYKLSIHYGLSKAKRTHSQPSRKRHLPIRWPNFGSWLGPDRITSKHHRIYSPTSRLGATLLGGLSELTILQRKAFRDLVIRETLPRLPEPTDERKFSRNCHEASRRTHRYWPH